jgi:RecB family exonuclease
MIAKEIAHEKERFVSNHTPYLSYSRINRYLQCPEQYRLYYVENLRPKVSPANLVFGQVMHQSLAHLFGAQGDPLKFFQERWHALKNTPLDYGKTESWAKLELIGRGLLEEFLQKELSRFGKIEASEKAFELKITGMDLAFVGIIDLIAELDGKRTVVDFKTSASAYQAHEVLLSDQLSAYQLAEPAAENSALCVLVKTQKPKIEWHKADRTASEVMEFLAKVDHIAGEIVSGCFYRRPGKWCSWCDYLPVCIKDTEKANATLICSASPANPAIS